MPPTQASLDRKSLYLAIGLTLAITSSAMATSFVRASIEDLATESSHVVRGHFVEFESRWNDERTLIYTRAVVEVTQTFAGTLSSRRIVVYLPGGTVEDTSMLVIGAPTPRFGTDTVLMLRAAPETDAGMEAFAMVGLSQGAFDVLSDPDTGEEYAVSHALGQLDLLRRSRRALRSDSQTMPLTELVAQVRTATGQ